MCSFLSSSFCLVRQACCIRSTLVSMLPTSLFQPLMSADDSTSLLLNTTLLKPHMGYAYLAVKFGPHDNTCSLIYAVNIANIPGLAQNSWNSFLRIEALSRPILLLPRECCLKMQNVFPKVTFPPWLHPSHREWIMEKTRKFQIVYAGLSNICQHSITDLVRGIMMNNLRCRRHNLSTILKLQAAF